MLMDNQESRWIYDPAAADDSRHDDFLIHAGLADNLSISEIDDDDQDFEKP